MCRYKLVSETSLSKTAASTSLNASSVTKTVDDDDDFYGDTSDLVQRDEIESYLADIPSPRTAKALDVWRGLVSQFPILSKMAKDYLAIPATSIPSKQIFLQAGDLITKKRNHLAKDSISMIFCLKNWGVIVETGELDFIDNEVVEATVNTED